MIVFWLLAVIYFGVVGLAIYFTPTIIAWATNNRNIVPIWLFNFFLGWVSNRLDCRARLELQDSASTRARPICSRQ